MPKQWPRLAAAAFGFLWYLRMGGGPTLNPATTSWAFYGDWRIHWLGWQFFRDAPWTFPLGMVPTLPYPIGTVIGFTDSNPLVSILLKPFSPWLPAEAQFIGPWLALCFTLQGYFGAALASVVTRDRVVQMLGGFLFVLSPVLTVRVGHDTLCAHWILLALLYLGLREYPSQPAAARAPWKATGLVAIAAGTHPYLAAMSLCLAIVLSVRLWADQLMSPARAAAAAIISVAALVMMFFVVGFLTGASPSGSGFGDYSADLLTFLNPDVLSNLFSWIKIPILSPQWEGIGYLGLGGIVGALCALVFVVRVRPDVPRRFWIVGAAALLLGLYALSHRVRFGGTLVLSLGHLYGPFMKIVTAFRASGRFIWPLHYMILLASVWAVSRVGSRLSRFGGIVALAAVVILQAVDLHFDRYWLMPKPFRHASVAGFELARGRFRHMALAPMQVLGVCGDPYEEDYVYRYMTLAMRLKLTFNSGVFARLYAPPIDAECTALEQRINTGALDSDTIYVVSPISIDRFKAIGAGCGRFDGDWVCVSKDSDERFRRYVETGK